MSRGGFFNNAEARRRNMMQRSRVARADSDSELDDENSVEADRKLRDDFLIEAYSLPLFQQKKGEPVVATSVRPKP